MSDFIPTPQLEEEIRAATAVPQADEKFIKSLQNRLIQQAAVQRKVHRPFFLRPAWAITLLILLVMTITTLVIGPQKVYAEFLKLFGYIPGVGIVDTSAPIRVLAEPVTVTREGISITVVSAILTADHTHIEYRIFGVPGSAYPKREDVTGCIDRPYLLLADGTRLEEDAPIQTNINAATYVMPCIFNTLPETTPTNWSLPLKFVAAPPDMTVMPVIDISPSSQASLTPETLSQPAGEGVTPAAPANNRLTILKEIETGDGYILVAQLPSQGPAGDRVVFAQGEIKDTSGKVVAFTYPTDVDSSLLGLDPNGSYWLMQFRAAGLDYPLNLTYSGLEYHRADPNATAEFTFDAGPNPQPGQEWKLNQDIQLDGHTLKLASITATSHNGYSFRIQGDGVYSVGVEIVGHTAVGGGGGTSPVGMDSVSVSYAQMPTGVLRVILSNLVVTGGTLTWQGQWTPANPPTSFPTSQPGVCLEASSLASLSALPSELAKGKALVYQKLEGSEKWGLMLYNLDGSSKLVVAADAAWGALSPDGSQVAYSPFSNTVVDIHIMDLTSQSVRTLAGISGTGYHWSTDGKQIAYIASSESAINGVFVVNADGSNNRQISGLSYETILGWAADGSRLYFGAPYTGGSPWKVFAYDLASGETNELFTIENGTPKALDPTLSPDGQWIAYRGKDNSSLYLVRPDGSGMHLVLDNVGVGSVTWTSSGWLGVSRLYKTTSSEESIILVKPNSCEAYWLPNLNGELEGLFIP